MITELYKALIEAGSTADAAERAATAVADQEGLKQEIKNAELRLEVKIAETKADLIRWVVGVGLLQTAMIAALLIKLAPH
jgi:hypothetical protein